jgi:hypothetical protein
MKLPTRIQLSRRRGFKLPPNTINCARPGPLGNPFIVGIHGTVERCVDLHWKLLAGYLCVSVDEDCITRQEKLMKYLPRQLERMRTADFLACWCNPDSRKPCHVENYLKILRSQPSNK